VQPFFEVTQVALGEILDVDTGDGGGHPLELTDLGYHLGRHRDPQAWRGTPQDLGGAALVSGVRERVQEADRDGFDPALGQFFAESRDGVLVQRRSRTAVGEDTLRYAEAQVPWHQGRGQLDELVVELVPMFPAHLQDIRKPSCGKQSGARAGALDQCVRDQRGAVHELFDVCCG
jgi:hypothetical protein